MSAQPLGKITITNVRLAFPDLLKATTGSGGEGAPAYRAQFLMPANDPQKAKIDALIREVALSKLSDPKKADAFLKSIHNNPQKCCWIDGDIRTYDGYAGHWALSANRKEDKPRPSVVDRMREPLINPETGKWYPGKEGRLYPGCYVNAIVQFWMQKNEHGMAMRCELLGVQFVKDGDAFGGGGSASADEFEDLGEGADADSLV